MARWKLPRMRAVGGERASSPLLNLALSLLLLVSITLNSIWLGSTAASRRTAQKKGSRNNGAYAHDDASSGIHSAEPEFDFRNEPSKEELATLFLGCAECQGTALWDVRAHLKDIVLVFNIETEGTTRNVSRFLHRIYERFFREVIVLGPVSIPDEGVTGREFNPWEEDSKGPSGGCGDSTTRSGIAAFGYLNLPRIMGWHPNAAGYLWVEEGVVLNYWQLIRADPDKLWLTDLSDNKRCQGFVPFNPALPASVVDGWVNNAAIRKRAQWARDDMSLQQQLQLEASVLNQNGNASSFPKHVVDAFYVPRRHAPVFGFDLVPVFRQHAVVRDVAIPMMFYALESPDKFDYVLRRVEHQGELRNGKQEVAGLWSVHISAFYYWDLNAEEQKAKLIKVFSEADPCLLKLGPALVNQTLLV